MPDNVRILGLFSMIWVLAMGLSQPVLAQDTPEASTQEVGESAEVYLAPLRAVAADETAFVAMLESMGDQEVLRLEDASDKLKSADSSQEDMLEAGRALEIGLKRLEWLCDEGVQRYSENAKVRNFRGNVYYDNFGKQIEGVKEWHTATMLDSKFSEPYNNLGMHYFHAGRYPLGFQNMDKALELEPNNPDFCFNLAQNYFIFGPEVEKKRGWSKKRVYQEAMKLSKRAVKNAPDDYQLLEDYAVNYLAAENFGVKADWKDAAKAWQAAREHAPSTIKTFYTWLNEGRMWKYANKNKEAKHCFEAALEIMPGNDVVTKLLKEVDGDA